MAQKPRPQWEDDLAKKFGQMLLDAFKKSDRKVFKAERAASKARAQMRKQGKPLFAEEVTKTMKQARKDRAAREAQRRINANIEYGRRKIKGGGSKAADLQTRSEAAVRKGTTIRRGREVPISKKKTEEMVTQSKRATAQARRGNAARRAEQQKMMAEIRAAQKAGDAAKVNKMVAKMNAHVKRYGRFS
jgi:hypothetical protein